MPCFFMFVALSLLSAASVSAQSFGFKTGTDTKNWILSSGKGLTITMVQASCDIVSIKYNGQELQSDNKGTQLNSGLGHSVKSSITTLSDAVKTIQITCEVPGLTQYYFLRANENALYMGTYHSSDLKLPELRFLARLSRSTVTTGVAASTLDGTVGAIEAHDIYVKTDNTTRSKFYSGVPFIEDQVHGVSGPKAGVYFVMSSMAYETSVGGPFHRDINNQCTTANELTFYMNSDHTRTEDYRFGFHGPYALVFTTGAAPPISATNFDLFQGLGLKGFVDSAKRGRVTGTIKDSAGVLDDSAVVVGFSNAAAQYWTKLTAGATKFSSPPMKPGTYTATIYKKQLPVGTASVTVAAGKTTTQPLSINFTENADTLWRIGDWDGTPDGFLNADKIHKMHPSDARMAVWKPISFAAGKDKDASFPMALFRGVNDPLMITFSLKARQAAAPHVLKIGVTIAQASGRPTVQVNSKWTAPTQASVAVHTRGVTRGTTTGNYIIYEYNIPASAFVTGANVIALGIASGDTDPPEPFLAASVVFDALQLDKAPPADQKKLPLEKKRCRVG